MRQCPKCKVDFQVVRKTFAEIDVCPQCSGVFLDPGEGIATHGADSEASFLVHDGRAQIVRISPYQCPSSAHEPTAMKVYAIGFGEGAIEIDYCPRCTGFFLDAGEGAALDALDANEVTTASGARFSAPPAVDNQAKAIAQAQEEGNKGLFATFVTDMFRSAAGALQHATSGDPHESRLERRMRQRRRYFER